MDFSKKFDRLESKYHSQLTKTKSYKRRLEIAEQKIEKINSAYKDKEVVDITTTISAMHELRKVNRKLDIYHVAMIAYAKEVGKFTSSQFMSRFLSGKNRFYEVMSDMRELGYIDSVDVVYKRKRVYFYLTDKGEKIYQRLNNAILIAKKQSKIKRMNHG